MMSHRGVFNVKSIAQKKFASVTWLCPKPGHKLDQFSILIWIGHDTLLTRKYL